MKDDVTVPDEFVEFLRKEMVKIDEAFAAAGIPIPDRPLRGARRFVDHCLVEVEIAGQREILDHEVILKPWFKPIYQCTLAWYEDRYGQALVREPNPLTGASIVFGVPFLVNVPATASKVETEGETAWLIFPIDLQEGEDPLAWIANPPNLHAMPEADRDQIRGEIGELASLLRRTYVHLMTAERPDDVARALAENVLTHLQSAAQLLAQQRPPHNLGLACWEAHQGVEKALKLYIRQRTNKHPKTHELTELASNANLCGGLVLNGPSLALLPNKNAVIALRAGEGPSMNLEDAHRIYKASLRLVEECAAGMPRRYVMNNARFLIKKLPFIG